MPVKTGINGNWKSQCQDTLERSGDCGKLQNTCPEGVKEGVGKVLLSRCGYGKGTAQWGRILNISEAKKASSHEIIWF